MNRLLAMGIKGFIHKSGSAKEIVAAMAGIMEGGVCTLMSPNTGACDESLPNLTKRQTEVLEHIALGRSNKEIARALSISLHTVRLHVSAILAELGAPSRSAAAAMSRDIIAYRF